MIKTRVNEIFDEPNPDRQMKLARELRTVFQERMTIMRCGTRADLTGQHINDNTRRIIHEVFAVKGK